MHTVMTHTPSASWIPFAAATDDLKFLDEGFADVLEVAQAHSQAPALLETRGAAVETITGGGHAETPVWLITLKDEFSGLVEQLAGSTPVVSSRSSTDLRSRRTTIEWRADGVAVCAYPYALRAIEDQLACGTVIVIFATNQKTVVTELNVDGAFRLEVHAQDSGNQRNYNPKSAYTKGELANAFVESVLFGYRARVDDAGRELVHLENYSYLYDSIS